MTKPSAIGDRLSLPVLAAGAGEPEAREKCGVFGAWGVPLPARMTCYGLLALQHRGQESAGVAVTDGAQIQRHTGMGLVASACPE